MLLKRLLKILLFMMYAAPLASALAASDPNDAAGCKDPALFSRMPGFHINNCQELDFDRFDFIAGPDKKETVEGRHYYVDYYANDGIKTPSGLQITHNYVNAVKAIGGKLIYEYEDGGTRYAVMNVVKDTAEVWVEVEGADNGMYKVNIIEKQQMKQEVTANAEAMAGSIKESGRVAIYGIYFDTGKAEIKPQSEPALVEIAKLLKNDPALKLYVVGHTDNAGQFDYNIKLSKERAAAVVKALVASHGIAAARLTPFGDGPTAPVASNLNEEGRAKNRRVELVAQ